MLSGYRLLDLAEEPGALCAKVFADLGGEVLKIEPPGGSRQRDRAPFAGGEAGVERSLHFAACNAGKRGLTLDLEPEEGREISMWSFGSLTTPALSDMETTCSVKSM